LADTSIHTVHYSSPLGVLQLQEENGHLIVVSFVNNSKLSTTETTASPVLNQTIQQLDEYFAGIRKEFDLPLQASGTVFQQTVWKQLLLIPFAETITYLHLAKRLGNVKSIRAAASANGKNPLAIIIPCHRVVGADGKLTGYAGGLHRKQWLLEHEANASGKQSSLF
jgi:methylated-DNA-[protein]-cysteine S-methyltransferase